MVSKDNEDLSSFSFDSLGDGGWVFSLLSGLISLFLPFLSESGTGEISSEAVSAGLSADTTELQLLLADYVCRPGRPKGFLVAVAQRPSSIC